MPFQVVIGLRGKMLPPAVENEARRRLVEIATSLDAIPEGAIAIWDSLAESTLHVDVSGWRVTYRVYRENDAVVAETAGFIGVP